MNFLHAHSDLIAAILDIAIIGVVIAQVRRLRIPISRTIIAVVLFFAVRAISRLAEYRAGPIHPNPHMELVLDLTTIVLLGYILMQVPRIARTVLAAVDEGRYRADEYERALRHYTQVVRHRVLNPITVIKGSAVTLKSGILSNPETAQQLCDAIIEMADEIEHTALDPERRDALEHDLDAKPRTRAVTASP